MCGFFFCISSSNCFEKQKTNTTDIVKNFLTKRKYKTIFLSALGGESQKHTHYYRRSPLGVFDWFRIVLFFFLFFCSLPSVHYMYVYTRVPGFLLYTRARARTGWLLDSFPLGHCCAAGLFTKPVINYINSGGVRLLPWLSIRQHVPLHDGCAPTGTVTANRIAASRRRVS